MEKTTVHTETVSVAVDLADPGEELSQNGETRLNLTFGLQAMCILRAGIPSRVP